MRHTGRGADRQREVIGPSTGRGVADQQPHDVERENVARTAPVGQFTGERERVVIGLSLLKDDLRPGSAACGERRRTIEEIDEHNAALATHRHDTPCERERLTRKCVKLRKEVLI